MGVVADDITGSNDIGGMFAKAGYRVHIYTYQQPADYTPLADPQANPEICILNTNSRLDAPQLAYQKVFAATRALQAAGYRQFFNKTCSVFRGNIGVEFDAMLDALHREFAVVVLGFPKNGRTTVSGIHYVRGVRLEESEFQNDPIHPMRRSDLVGILQSQTRRTVGLITCEVVRQGAELLRSKIAEMRAQANYVILDVADQADLATIAAAAGDEMVLCGSSALAEELPAVWGGSYSGPQQLNLPFDPRLGILVAAGSLMPQTAAQIQYLESRGATCIEMDARRLFTPPERDAEITRLVEAVAAEITAARHVVFHSPNEPAAVEATRQAGAQAGYSGAETARHISAAIAEITARALDRTAQNRLVVAGGETSAAVCDRLGVNAMSVWQEIQPGLPSCVSLTEPRRLLVLKSGSFGQPDFFVQAIDHLRSQ